VVDRSNASRRAFRGGAPLVTLLVLGALATPARADLEVEAGPVVAAARADTLATNLGRYMLQGRWNEVLDEELYTIAPKGAWNETHPAWRAARASLAMAIRRESLSRLDGDAGRMLHEVVIEHYSSLSPDDRARTIAFYESPGGRAWLDLRQKAVAEAAYGQPYAIETVPRADYKRALMAAKKKVRHLPDDQTHAVYDFTNSHLGQQLIGMENNVISDVALNILSSDLEGILIVHGDAIARPVRAEVPAMPPPSAKAYLGTVTMRPNRTLELAIEYHDHYRLAGTYRLEYAPGSLHWAEVAAAAPGIAPGESRFLYRDPGGYLSDTP
jgi:hypothetical protein